MDGTAHVMSTISDPNMFARDWVSAWNSHDLDRILDHYAANVILISPVVIKLNHHPLGQIQGLAALRAYFQRGLDAFPTLKFELLEVLAGVSSVVLLYVNQRGSHTAEYMEFDETGKVNRVIANYSA